ncbi:MAG: hypothetical protein WC525_04380 [Candidatus Thermoplasmatota archaeon]
MMTATCNTSLLSTVRRAINITALLLTLAVLSSSFGYTTTLLLPLLGFFLLLGIVLLNLPLRQTLRCLSKTHPHLRTLLFGVLFCTAGFLLLITTKTPLLWISSVPLIISGLDLCLRAADRQRSELHLLAVTSFGYAMVFLLLQTIPLAWSLYQQSSLAISHGLGVLTTTPLSLGPTTSGLRLLLVFLSVLISGVLLLPRKTRKQIGWFCLCATGLCLLWVSYLLVLNLVSYPSTEAFHLHPYFFIIGLVPTLGFFLRTADTAPSSSLPHKTPLKQHLKNGAVWAMVLVFLSTSLLTVFINSGDSSLEQHTVTFYAGHMVGTWDVPEYGTYGKDAVGMFGLWPIYLATLGYTTELLVENATQFLNATQPSTQNITRYLNLTDYATIRELPSLTQTTLDNTAIFVVSNLNESFSEQERTIIWEYVNNGGSLLVIGDHTNVGGIQLPLNHLLAPVGIRYRFDSALPLDETFSWLTCTQALHHPVTVSLPRSDVLQYGIGASLEISSSAFPLLIGSAALSDQGDEANPDVAYLGDYEYTKGEQLGDVILIAGAYYGAGKVLVFGDTSSFQNPALPFSSPFLSNTFRWLSSNQTGSMTLLQRACSLLLLILAVLLYYVFRRNTVSFAGFPLVFCVALLLTTLLNPLFFTTTESTLADNLVYIDTSHGERFSKETFTDDSVNGLIMNLQRNNLLPVLLREFSQDPIMNSRILVFLAPTAAFSAEEVRFLQRYMTQGGVVILATGYDDKLASLPLLQAFNVDVEPIPLGPVPYVEENLTLYQNEPRFVDSWPLSFPQAPAQSYYNFTWDNLTYHLVVFLPQGAGGLVVISDSRYLLDKNLESIYDYWPGNILFIKYLLDEVLKTEEQP